MAVSACSIALLFNLPCVLVIDLKIENLDRVSIPAKIVPLLILHARFMGPLLASEEGVHSKLFLCTLHSVGRVSYQI